MNKAEIVDQLAKEHSVSKTQAEAMLNSTLDIIKKSVKKGDVVTLVGFGSFYKAKRKARNDDEATTECLMGVWYRVSGGNGRRLGHSQFCC